MNGLNKQLKAKIIEHFGSQFLFSIFIQEHEYQISRVIRGHRTLSAEERKKWAEVLQADESIFNQGA